MKKLIAIFLFAHSLLYAAPLYNVAVIDASADYKAKIGGGHYDLENAEIWHSEDGVHNKIVLTLTKRQNKFTLISQTEEFLVDVINPSQVSITSDLGSPQYMPLSDNTNITIQTTKGTLNVNIKVYSVFN